MIDPQKNLTILFYLMVAASGFAQETAAILPVVSGSSNGPSIDKAGTPVVDPTKNVLDLVRALEKRLDDIQTLTNKGLDDRFKYRESITELQAQITTLQTSHNADAIKLRADYQKMLDENESKRIDSIRAVDQAAVKNESDRAQQAVNTLATAQSATAETLRSAVNTTATNIATQLDRTTSAIVERIASLEKAQYTGAGRAGVADPQIDALRASVEKLAAAGSLGAGKTEGVGSTWTVLAGIIAVIGVMFGIFSANQRARRQDNDDLHRRVMSDQ